MWWVGLDVRFRSQTSVAWERAERTTTWEGRKVMASWVKIESKRKPGYFYYFNEKTGETTWRAPPELTEECPIGISVKQQRKPTLTHQQPARGSVNGVKHTVTSRKPNGSSVNGAKPPPLTLHFNSNNNGNTVGSTAGLQTGGMASQTLDSVAMETEKWGEDEEVAMDVDMSEEDQLLMISEVQQARGSIIATTSSAGLEQLYSGAIDFSDMLYIVLDTNILLSHLQFLDELKDYSIKGVGRPILVVPWVVMQELDALKTTERVGNRAHKAISFLHACFSSRHPRVRGQTLEEVHTEIKNLAIANNDDKILHCCLLYQMKVRAHQGTVILFSNDIQLCSKAMVNDIKALNRKTLFSELRMVTRNTTKTKSYSETQEYAVRMEQELKQAHQRAIADDLLCEAESAVREGLSAAVEQEMIEAYGDGLWLAVVAIKPPWVLKDLVYLLDKHWVAVFGLVLPHLMKEVIASLQHHVRYRNTRQVSFKDVENFLHQGRTILLAFSPKSPSSGGVLSHCLAALSVLNQRMEEAKSGRPVQAFETKSVRISTPVLPPPSPLLALASPDDISKESLQMIAHNPPQDPPSQLKWILQVIFETLKYCRAQVIGELQKNTPGGQTGALHFLAQICELVKRIITAMNNLINNGPNIPRMQELLLSFEGFLAHVLMVSSPLTLDSFYLLSNEPGTSEILQQALREYAAFIHQLEEIGEKFHL